jgi:hypothetical protein
MARDRTLAIRRAMMIKMAGAADVLAVVNADSIFPQTTAALPAFPFIRMGAPSPTPRRGACVDGADTIVAVHGFAKGRADLTAEDEASAIGAAIASVLDGASLALEGGGSARVLWTGSQLLQDPDEANAFHSIVNFRVRHLA